MNRPTFEEALLKDLDRKIKRLKIGVSVEMDWIQDKIKEAIRELSSGRCPNSCGIIQGSGSKLDSLVSNLATLMELKKEYEGEIHYRKENKE